jgi:predicted ester cyclase
MAEQNQLVCQQVLDELFDKGNLDAADELIHPDFVNHEAPPDNPQGPEGLKETVTWLRGLWGPMRMDVQDWISEDDKVVARVTVRGRHVGEFLGKEPTGKEYEVEHIHIWRLEDGKVIEHWSVRDDLNHAMQLGLIGAPG